MRIVKYEGWIFRHQEYPALLGLLGYVGVALTLANFEHLGSAHRAHTLSCRPAIFHGYPSSVLHFPFGTALHTVCLHLTLLFLE